MAKELKKRAPRADYVSPNQLVMAGFESPFSKQLDSGNRWVVLAGRIPWDEISNLYLKHVGVSDMGRPGLSPRVAIGSLMIKHICNLDDRETVQQISENMYMQYFLGYSTFTAQVPFDASLFVDLRKRIGAELLNSINARIVELHRQGAEGQADDQDHDEPGTGLSPVAEEEKAAENNTTPANQAEPAPKGRVLFDATVCPQDIAYPTDLELLNESREKTEALIDVLYDQSLHASKPRTYRVRARRDYLKVARKRRRSKAEMRRAIGKQLNYVKRNLRTIDRLLDTYDRFPLDARQQKYLLVVRTLYDQQREMHSKRVHSIADRIVSIHQPHVRPMVRGKAAVNTEFGAKIHLSMADGYAFLDEVGWDAYNEGSHMREYIERYRRRFGHYPAEVLADGIYCTRENRRMLKEKGIRLLAKPLGRPPAVKVKHVRPGERNPVEGKFGQAKTAYGMDRIRARLKPTSEAWIACIVMVLNLVRLAGQASLWLFFRMVKHLVTFSATSKLALAPLINDTTLVAKTTDREWNRWKIAC